MSSHPEDNEHLLHQLLNSASEFHCFSHLGTQVLGQQFLAKGNLKIAEMLMDVIFRRKQKGDAGLGPLATVIHACRAHKMRVKFKFN